MPQYRKWLSLIVMLRPEIRQRLRNLKAGSISPLILPACPRRSILHHEAHSQSRSQVLCTDRTIWSYGCELSNAYGRYWLVERSLREIWSQVDDHLEKWEAASVSDSNEVDPLASRFRQQFPRGVIFFDLETCGLSGSAIFLIGVLCAENGDLILRQYWARSYAEEGPVLAAFTELLGTKPMLVSFNGKSFDWPQVCDRTVVHRVSPCLDVGDPELRADHWDLLHVARRRWRTSLPDCRLQTLEQWICGRRRVDDIPGHAIPAVYHEYVRTSDWQLVEPILHHNALDLITLLQLAITLAIHPR